MRYEMLTIRPNGPDDIVTLLRKPNGLERLFGAHEQQLTAYGHGDSWWTMDGVEASGRLRRFLQGAAQDHSHRLWNEPEPASRREEGFDLVDEAGDESFPASDPPAWTRTRA